MAAQTFPSHPQELLATSPAHFAELLERVRPVAVTAEEKARILRSLPDEGEATPLDRRSRAKLSSVDAVLRAMKREGVYEIKIIDVPQAAAALYARTVVLISRRALELVSADELQALVAHEIGHEYVWTAYERAKAQHDAGQIKQLELVCDMIAIVTIGQLGLDHSRLSDALEKVAGDNRRRFGFADNERDYPTVTERRAFAEAVARWVWGGAR